MIELGIIIVIAPMLLGLAGREVGEVLATQKLRRKVTFRRWNYKGSDLSNINNCPALW